MLAVVEKLSVADICKCSRSDCPLSKSCFRFLAEASDYQAYFIIEELPENCTEYWEVKDEEHLKELNRIWRD